MAVTETLSTAQLKSSLISKSLEFKAAQKQLWEQQDMTADENFALGREANDVTKTDERLKSPLAAEGFGNVEVELDAALAKLREEVISLIEALSERSPTPEPFGAWRQRSEPVGACPLEGTWMLLFTTGADATFRKTEQQGEATTFTQINARRGHITNCVDFSSETAKLKGFRVVVAGVPLSADEVQLKFRRVKLLRRSRWLKTIVIPLPPSRLLRALSRWASKGKGQMSSRGAGFKVLYLDDTMRMHLTFDGQFFVQMRPEAYEAVIADAAAAAAVPAAAPARGGSPSMGFADWGKGDRVATASHILVKERSEALRIKALIEGGQISFVEAAKKWSTCGSAPEGGTLGSFVPGEMVPEFDAYCFDPASVLEAVGVVDTDFGTHLIRLEKQSLGVAEGKATTIKKRKMLDRGTTPFLPEE